MNSQIDNPNALLNIYQTLNDQQLAQIANTPGNPYSFLAVGVAQQRAKERMGAATMQPQPPTVRDQAVGQMMQAGLAAAPENRGISTPMATGGLVALAHGGYVKGYSGEDGSEVESAYVPQQVLPDTLSSSQLQALEAIRHSKIPAEGYKMVVPISKNAPTSRPFEVLKSLVPEPTPYPPAPEDDATTKELLEGSPFQGLRSLIGSSSTRPEEVEQTEKPGKDKTPEGASVQPEPEMPKAAKPSGVKTQNQHTNKVLHAAAATTSRAIKPSTSSPGIPSAASSSSTTLMNPSSQLVRGESYGVPEKAAQPAAEAYSPEETITELMRLRGGAYQYPKELMDKLAEREAAANTEKWLSAGLAGLSGAMGAQTPWRGQAIAEGLRQGLSQYEKGSAAEDAAALANLKMQMEQAKAPYDARGEGYKTYVDMLKAKAAAEAGIDKALINAQRAVDVQRLRNEGYGAKSGLDDKELAMMRNYAMQNAKIRLENSGKNKILDEAGYAREFDRLVNEELSAMLAGRGNVATGPGMFSGMGSGTVAPVMQSPYATILHH